MTRREERYDFVHEFVIENRKRDIVPSVFHNGSAMKRFFSSTSAYFVNGNT